MGQKAHDLRPKAVTARKDATTIEMKLSEPTGIGLLVRLGKPYSNAPFHDARARGGDRSQ